jgi:membrane-associated protein
MTAIGDYFLTGLMSWGAPLFGLALLLGAIGLPLPTSLLVVATGAFGRQGMLDLPLAAVLGLICAVTGDSISFAFGRWGGTLISRRFGASKAWLGTKNAFERNSRLAVFLTRFLFTVAAIPVNLMAGASCRYLRFLVTVIVGESVWLGVYGGLGFLFGSQWELISQFLADLSGLAFGLAIFATGLVISIRSIRRKTRRPTDAVSTM